MAIIQTVFQPCPCDEHKTLSENYSGSGVKHFDFSTQKETGIFKGVKTVFIDNSSNADEFSLFVDDTGQSVKCAGGKQGYYPVLTGDIKFTGQGNGNVKLQFLNFEISQGEW